MIASHNPGKIREIGDLLKPYHIDVVSGPSFGFSEPDETEETFVGNTYIKSRYFVEKTRLPSLSDDSGLAVDALDGAQGIYSARWAGEAKDFRAASARIQAELIGKTGTDQGHRAHFVCALSLCWPDGEHVEFEGKVFGTLVFPARGRSGFGYDPIFVPDGYGVTFGEMHPDEKHRISHRADAFRQLIQACFT